MAAQHRLVCQAAELTLGPALHLRFVLLRTGAPYFGSITNFEVVDHDIPCNGKPICKLCQKEDSAYLDTVMVSKYGCMPTTTRILVLLAVS